MDENGLLGNVEIKIDTFKFNSNVEWLIHVLKRQRSIYKALTNRTYQTISNDDDNSYNLLNNPGVSDTIGCLLQTNFCLSFKTTRG